MLLLVVLSHQIDMLNKTDKHIGVPNQPYKTTHYTKKIDALVRWGGRGGGFGKEKESNYHGRD